jgi:hypothetical protein
MVGNEMLSCSVDACMYLEENTVNAEDEKDHFKNF